MKRKLLMIGPFSTRSGYGEHARDIFNSFYDLDKFEIYIQDTRWGDTPRDALKPDNPIHRNIVDCFMSEKRQLTQQPDVCVDVRIPQEFETHGKFNIGITAGIETDAVSQKWLEGVNKMDLIIVPSEHSKEGFIKSVYDKIQQMPNGQQQKIGEFKLEKPIEVLFEGFDENIYKPLNADEIDSEFFDMLNEKVPEKFAYLHVGQWCKGGYGEDRKDIGKLIKVFFETFIEKSGQVPALILKTSGATYSLIDREDILNKINEIKKQFPSGFKLPNVYLLHGDLSAKEMNYLYNHPKIKAFVSFTHGEGFGRPLLEASAVGLPVIASNWSGQCDFLDKDYSILVGGTLDNVPKSVVWQDIIIEQSRWFNINESEASKALTYAYTEKYQIKERAKKLMTHNRKTFTLNKMTEKLGSILDEHLKDIPQQVGLKLPKLKLDSNSSKKQKAKIKLPSLKQV
tara:strand:- start:13903 stop:15267 length:1365 start_codon:yes stop_codon:yes gene_type:complete